MKWIKTRQKFLSEAKIGQVLFPRQSKEVAKTWGEKYLDYEEIVATDKIIQGKWKLSEEDKLAVLGTFFQCDMKNVFSAFQELPDRFCHILAQSIDASLTQDPKRYSSVLKDFNPKEPTIDQIVVMFDSIFRKLNTSETMGDSMIQKDKDGRPVKDDAGQMIRISKEKGAPIFTNNLINIISFCDDYNRCFPDEKVSKEKINNYDVLNLRNIAKEDCNGRLEVDFEIFNRDLYLSISHNPKDILNMSISKFYNSCQNMYDGGYRHMVLSNVFDPNSIPAFFTFDTPIFWGEEKVSDQLPLSRMIIRNIEDFSDGDKKIFFDRAYPDRMKRIFDDILPKYSGNKQTVHVGDVSNYIFTPDIEPSDKDVKDPYMDKLGLRRMPYIGVNCKSLYLNRVSDWSNVRVSPAAKIKELIIETTKIPENLFKINLNLDWIKFKYLSLKTLEPFDKLITNSIALDKCEFSADILNVRSKTLKKLQIVSCDASNLDFSSFTDLEELHLIYTLNDLSELKNSIANTKIKKLVISGDLVSSKEGDEFVKSLKKGGMKVEIKGPKI